MGAIPPLKVKDAAPGTVVPGRKTEIPPEMDALV